MIPFEVFIQKKDRDLRLVDKLRAELPGILNWAVQGCLEWQKQGLQPPRAVEVATQNYRSEMDVLQLWIEESCEVSPDLSGKSSELYESYCNWLGRKGRPMSQPVFKRRMEEHGFSHKKERTNVVYEGVDVVKADEF